MSLLLTLSKSTVTYSPGLLYNIPPSGASAIASGFATRFPASWVSQSSDPGIQVQVTNNSLSAPIAPILMDTWVSGVDSGTYYYTMAEMSTVQPGATVTETIAGIPCTQLWLALPYLAIESTDTVNGWTVNVQAWAV